MEKKKKEYKKKVVSHEQQQMLMRIGTKVRELRKKNTNFSILSFSTIHDINHQTYYRLETGENFTMNTLLTVLKIHGISLKEFTDSL